MKQQQTNTYIIEYTPGRRYEKEYYRGMVRQSSVDELGSDVAFKRRLKQHQTARKDFLYGKTLLRMVITSIYTEKELKRLTHEMAANRVNWAFDRPEMPDQDWAFAMYDAGNEFAVPRFKPFWRRCEECDGTGEGTYDDVHVLKCDICGGTGGVFLMDDAIADAGICPRCGCDLMSGCECDDDLNPEEDYPVPGDDDPKWISPADDLDTGHEEEFP